MMKASVFWTIVSILFMGLHHTLGDKENLHTPQNSMVVKLTDSPANYSELYVEIREVAIYGENGGWITISDQQLQYINILSLTNGTTIELARLMDPPKDIYTKLMIRFGDQNSIYLYGDQLANGDVTTITKSLVWKGEKEIYMPIYKEIPKENQPEILLDFNVSESIIEENGNFFIKPVITIIENKETGISGNVEAKGMVSIVIFNPVNTYSTYANEEGNFLIQGVEPGVYDMLITSNQMSFDKKMAHKKYIHNITITDGVITDLSLVP